MVLPICVLIAEKNCLQFFLHLHLHLFQMHKTQLLLKTH